MARTSIQYQLLQDALAGITDAHTIRAYKQDCKLFAIYCREHGVKNFDVLKENSIPFLQSYEQHLEKSSYTPATIHRRLAAPCKGLGVNMNMIQKPKRLSGNIIRSRSNELNPQGKADTNNPCYSRLVEFQHCVGIRRSELARLTGKDLVMDESGYLCVHVLHGKGGKEQYQRVLPADILTVCHFFQNTPDDCKLFSSKELSNKIDLHSLRRAQAQKAYQYYSNRIRADPSYADIAKKELLKRYVACNPCSSKEKPADWLKCTLNSGKPYYLRGDNRSKAIAQKKPIVYDRLALLLVSVFHLSHWRLDVTITNYLI